MLQEQHNRVTGTRDEPRPFPSILGIVTGQINDARVINGRLHEMLGRLRSSSPCRGDDRTAEPERALVNAAEAVSGELVETSELLTEIERFV